MRALDLFAGKLGWSKAFVARGCTVVAVDLIVPAEIPEGVVFRQMDVLKINLIMIRQWEEELGGKFNFACASSPCQEFAKTCKGGMACFYPNAPYPQQGIALFSHTRSLLESMGIPYVMENVRGAEQWIGDANKHAGPFYLWGTGVPPLIPKGLTKGTTNMGNWNRNPKLGPQKSAAELALIPPELANCVADYAERLNK
jgi:hypothetical protein